MLYLRKGRRRMGHIMSQTGHHVLSSTTRIGYPRRDMMHRPRRDVPYGTLNVLFYFCPFVSIKTGNRPKIDQGKESVHIDQLAANRLHLGEIRNKKSQHKQTRNNKVKWNETGKCLQGKPLVLRGLLRFFVSLYLIWSVASWGISSGCPSSANSAGTGGGATFSTKCFENRSVTCTRSSLSTKWFTDTHCKNIGCLYNCVWRPPCGPVKLVFTKVINCVLLEQFHYKLMRVYGGGHALL